MLDKIVQRIICHVFGIGKSKQFFLLETGFHMANFEAFHQTISERTNPLCLKSVSLLDLSFHGFFKFFLGNIFSDWLQFFMRPFSNPDRPATSRQSWFPGLVRRPRKIQNNKFRKGKIRSHFLGIFDYSKLKCVISFGLRKIFVFSEYIIRLVDL